MLWCNFQILCPLADLARLYLPMVWSLELQMKVDWRKADTWRDKVKLILYCWLLKLYGAWPYRRELLVAWSRSSKSLFFSIALFQSSCRRMAIRRQLHRLNGHQRTMPKADFVSTGARRSEGVFGGAAGGWWISKTDTTWKNPLQRQQVVSQKLQWTTIIQCPGLESLLWEGVL